MNKILVIRFLMYCKCPIIFGYDYVKSGAKREKDNNLNRNQIKKVTNGLEKVRFFFDWKITKD